MSSKIEIKTDEITYQDYFYEKIFGEDFNINRDRSTDGYTEGVLFEHKLNVTSYGEAKALSQAIIYLTRFNRDGVPVPRYVCLVSQEEERCFIYDMENYVTFINDIESYAHLKASEGIPGFHNNVGKRHKTISYSLNSFATIKELSSFLEQPPQNIKVNINEHNVYGWATFYYENALAYKQKPEKKAFFNELRNPVGTLNKYINPWMGQETDFKYIMDILNDPATQKDLGAFYTPPLYVKKATELVKKAIERVPEGNDYVIIDRCAGTGNLEMYLEDIDEKVLSHVIISTYELKEWMVLKDRFKNRVRYIIPPVPTNPSHLPELNDDGFLTGANALTKDIMNNPEVKKYIENPNCTIIMYENPPFVESTETVKNEGKTIVQKKKAEWKNFEMAQKMSEEANGVSLNELGNVFIWTAFKYFLRQPTDSYILFSPIKYWKSQHLINKKFKGGFAFNRKHFHADNSCVTCIYWSNEDDNTTHKIKLAAFDIENGKIKKEEDIVVKHVFSTFAEKYYNLNDVDITEESNIICEINGKLSTKKPIGFTPIMTPDIIAYLVAYKNTFDRPRFCSMLLRAGAYNGHGFYLTKDDFVEKLPLFAASRYTDNCNNWKVMSMVMKSGDKAEQYKSDVKSGLLNGFLCKCLIWTSMTHYAHLRNFYGPDGVLYKNELCFDGNTLATQALNSFIDAGYSLSSKENELFKKYNLLLEMVKSPDESGNPKENFNKDFNYGLFQIDEEINLTDKILIAGGKSKTKPRYGDMNNLIKEIKRSLKEYYIEEIVPVLFEYEFLK